ncbi:uncharacterized protein [Paramisgurnus dabryanus]|uniref:uncharacterized protein n=1 Tax=Paramisgurnus dabryanus TaxID=90735 RepID=UPI0031F40619
MEFQQCPICLEEFARLSQHLRVTHQIINVEERRLLLALDSGRVSFRVGCCPVLGCGKDTTRLDRHLKTHRKLSQKARRNIVMEFKKKNIMAQLAALRASNPRTPMKSTLDLEDDNVNDDNATDGNIKDDNAKHDNVKAEDLPEVHMAEEELCCLESCRRKKLQLKSEVDDLNKQLSTLAASLQKVTQRFSALKRRCGSEVSEASEDNASPMSPMPQDSSTTSQQSFDQLEPSSPPHHPDQLLPLNEQHESSDLRKLRKNVGGKMLPEDNKFSIISHASQGLVMLRPLKQPRLRASHCSFAQVSPIKRPHTRAKAKFIVNKALKDSSSPQPQ